MAAGHADEELKADLIPLVLSCHLRPEPGGEWEAVLFPRFVTSNLCVILFFLTCLFLLGADHAAPSPGEERILPNSKAAASASK